MDQKPDNPYKFDDRARKIFLAALAETGRIYHAAASAGVSFTYIYQLKKMDDEFAEQVEDAMGIYRAAIEEEIHRRAIDGVIEKKYNNGFPVIEYELDHNGKIITDSDDNPKAVGQAFVRKYSDTLLLAHARRHIPEYNEKKQVDMKVSGLEGLLEEIQPSTGLPSMDEDLDSDENITRH